MTSHPLDHLNRRHRYRRLALVAAVAATLAASSATAAQRPPGEGTTGDGTRVHYYRRGSAASTLGPDLLRSDPVRAASLVHLTGITLALSPSCRELVTRALDVPLGERTYAVSFDVNHRPALWPDATDRDVLRDLADRADIVLVGLDEAQRLWGADLTPSGVREVLPCPAHPRRQGRCGGRDGDHLGGRVPGARAVDGRGGTRGRR